MAYMWNNILTYMIVLTISISIVLLVVAVIARREKFTNFASEKILNGEVFNFYLDNPKSLKQENPFRTKP